MRDISAARLCLAFSTIVGVAMHISQHQGALAGYYPRLLVLHSSSTHSTYIPVYGLSRCRYPQRLICKRTLRLFHIAARWPDDYGWLCPVIYMNTTPTAPTITDAHDLSMASKNPKDQKTADATMSSPMRGKSTLVRRTLAFCIQSFNVHF
jgi:hypothetical protein